MPLKTGPRWGTHPSWNRQFNLAKLKQAKIPSVFECLPTPHYNVLKLWLWCWGLAITHHLMSKSYCCSCQAIIFSWHNQIKHRNVLIRKEQQTTHPHPPTKHPTDPWLNWFSPSQGCSFRASDYFIYWTACLGARLFSACFLARLIWRCDSGLDGGCAKIAWTWVSFFSLSFFILLYSLAFQTCHVTFLQTCLSTMKLMGRLLTK